MAAGMSPSWVGQVIRGEVTNPSLGALKAVAETAGVSFTWLSTGRGSAYDKPDEEGRVSTTELTQLNLRLQSSESLNAFLISKLGRSVTPREYAELAKACRIQEPPTTKEAWAMLLRFVRRQGPDSQDPGRKASGDGED